MAFDIKQAKYIKSFPLHSTQLLIFEDEIVCRFEYYMHPTHDFLMEILKYGETVKIDEPFGFQNFIKEKITAMANLYN